MSDVTVTVQKDFSSIVCADVGTLQDALGGIKVIPKDPVFRLTRSYGLRWVDLAATSKAAGAILVFSSDTDTGWIIFPADGNHSAAVNHIERLQRRVSQLEVECSGALKTIEETWAAMGNRNKGHLSLDEAVTGLNREADNLIPVPSEVCLRRAIECLDNAMGTFYRNPELEAVAEFLQRHRDRG